MTEAWTCTEETNKNLTKQSRFNVGEKYEIRSLTRWCNKSQQRLVSLHMCVCVIVCLNVLIML